MAMVDYIAATKHVGDSGAVVVALCFEAADFGGVAVIGYQAVSPTIM